MVGFINKINRIVCDNNAVYIWWRRGESNSCPKTYSHNLLRVQFAV